MASIWDLFVSLKIDTGQFTEGMDKAASKSKATSGSLGGDFAKMAAGAIAAAGGVAILTGFIKDSIQEASDAQKAQAQLNSVLASTKNVAGLTAENVNDMAVSMGQLNAMDNDAIVSASNVLLTFTQIGKQVFPDAMQASLDLSAAMGQDLQSSIVQIGKALNDPITGMTALQRVGVTFSDTQKKQIADFQNANDLMSAQKVILDELNKEFGGSSVAAANTYEGSIRKLTNSLNNLKETMGNGILPTATATAKQLAVNSDMLQAGVPLLKVLAYNQRLYNLSEEEATKLLDYYYTSQKKVTESGMVQAALMDGRFTPAIVTQTQALYTGATGWAALPPFMQAYITKANSAYAASMQTAQAVATIDQNFKNMQVSAQNALDAVDNAKTAQQGFQQSFAQSVDAELKAKGLQGKALTDAEAIIDKKYGTELKWNTDVAVAAKALADKYANTGDLAAFSSAMDTKALELQTENDKLAAGLDLISKQTAGLAYLTGQTWMIDVMYRIQGGVPSAPASTWTGKHLNDAGAAGGANFTVPKGYPNDSFQLGVQTGEHVVVTPEGQTSQTTNNNGGNTYNIYVTGGANELMRKLKAMNGGAYQG